MSIILPRSKLPPELQDPTPHDLYLVDLMHKIADGDPRVRIYLQQMANLVRREEVFEWLVENRVTGQRLVGFVEEDHKGSLVKAMCDILRRINGDLVLAPLIVGKDIR